MSEKLMTEATFDDTERVLSRSKAGWHLAITIGGIALCFTGVGALIGVPMFLWGTFARKSVKGAWVGPCPACEAEIQWAGGVAETKQGQLNCTRCSARIDFYDGRFLHHRPA